MEKFEIGHKVTWTVGNITTIGCIFSENNEKDEAIDVLTHSIGGRRSVMKISVKKDLLTKI